MIIDFTDDYSGREIVQEEVIIKIGSEPWWFNAFWRKVFCGYILSWNTAYVIFGWYGYNRFQGYYKRPPPTLLDRALLVYEKIDNAKDLWFVFFCVHSTLIFLGLQFTILVPLVWTLTGPGHVDFISYIRVFFGYNPKGDKDGKIFAFVRWNIAARIAVFENIPQILLVLIEAFGLKKTMSFYQLLFPIMSTMCSVYHLALVTGEAFSAKQSQLPQPQNLYIHEGDEEEGA